MVTWAGILVAFIAGALFKGMGQEAGKHLFGTIAARLRRSPKGGLSLTGTWNAIWQTTVHDAVNVNSEVLNIEQKGTKLVIRNLARSEENRDGGYLWSASAELTDNRYICGAYCSLETNVNARGTLYLVISNTGQFMVGRWVGCNIDQELNTGLVVIARERSVALGEMRRRLLKAGDFIVADPALLRSLEDSFNLIKKGA
jgi:hypothetical protein